MSATFSSLSIRNYRLWFAGALVANVGTWMQRVAQDWLVLTDLTDESGVAVGITTALQFAPALLLSAWAGLLADRFDRRKLLLATQVAQGVLAAGLGALVLSGHAELWHVYVFAGLLGAVTAIDAPVRQTFVAELVPQSRLSNAVGLNSASFNAARLVGPGLAGLLIAAVGSGWVFVINAATFAATIVSLTLMRRSELHTMPHASRAKGQIREGIAYVRNRSDILVIMVVVCVVSTFGLNFQLTSALMARTEFGKGAQEYGVLGSVLAIGSLTGALLAARRERPRVRLVIGSAFGFGVATGVMALMPTYTSFAVACIPVGLASLTMMTAANTSIQMTTDPQMRGRVMSLYMMVFLGATPVGSPVVGWIGETFGARWSIGVGSISALLVSVGAALWARKHWDVRVRYRVARRPYVEVLYPADRAAAAAGTAAAAGEQDAGPESERVRAQGAADAQHAA
ncbi:major facilitator superfamily MFS_1 [Cellulomonas flavigena DSM 20109]|uniref:Major facilitator superfamily MFS_1 n=1 Tax=Cellulomonas flavigena (strain ATCC 482 / DSM 20109 / BCRC 11376 / JCM 18109 / NBRC 3775 / NCIMB 8073 / NRS 134) TaxID=446466 RepID=D5UJF5_CELFN|nr:MFS transporter [Cellulomonas flavigena]ADG73678.1 major facilitator superfamily MFS_1 [Cellulomonas flavigena DSM 20109]